MADIPNSEVLASVENGIGWLTLNRPKALNALSLGMIRALTEALLEWRDVPSIKAVVLQGEGGRALCAGGDIRFFHAGVLAGDPRVEDFFTEEYALNHLIHRYPKPYVALMNGVVMGGGMGISQGASLRIVTETTRIAMPETQIGLFPDIGASYFLSRTPGRLGEYLGMTGVTIDAADAIVAGLADVAIPSTRLREFLDGIASLHSPDQAALDRLAKSLVDEAQLPAATLAAQQEAINRCFAHATVQDIHAALCRETSASEWAGQTLALLASRSPLMTAVALEQVRRGRDMGLADCLRMERGMMRQSFHWRPGASEGVEGIRALVVDKDRRPQWNPARIDDVTPGMISVFFEPPWPAHAHPLRMLD